MKKTAKNGSIKLISILKNVRNKLNKHKKNAKKRSINVSKKLKANITLKKKRLLNAMKR